MSAFPRRIRAARAAPARPVSEHLPELTGLRALAALLVLMHHLEKWYPGSAPGFEGGHAGVSLFFALSGYLITVRYFGRFTAGKLPMGEYFARRFARIYPAYLVLLLVREWLSPESRPWSNWLSNLTVTQGFYFPDVWTGLSPVTWSLTVEESFYALAPLVFVLVARFARAPGGRFRGDGKSPAGERATSALGALAVLAPLCWLAWKAVFWMDLIPGRTIWTGVNMVLNVSIFARFGEFAVGMALGFARLSGSFETLRSWTSRGRRWLPEAFVATGIVFGALAWYMQAADWPAPGSVLSYELRTQLQRVLMASAAAAVIASSLLGGRVTRAVLGNRAAVYLGKVSYVAYLLNADVLLRAIHDLYARLGGPSTPLGGWGFYAFFTLFAAAGYELIEKPAHRLASRWLERPRKPVPVPSAAAAARLRPEYLEGMRGLAAWAVVLNHCANAFVPALTAAGGDPAAVSPAIRAALSSPLGLVLGGHFAVMIFFVHSGLVLSYRYFARGAGDAGLASAAARRYFRLAPPALGSVLLACALLTLGWTSAQTVASATDSWWLARQLGFAPDAIEALRQGISSSFFGVVPPEASYNSSLWTIATELVGSYGVFAFLAVVGGSRARAVAYVAAAALLFKTHFLAFLLGVALCDWHLAAARSASPRGRRLGLHPFVSPALFALGLYFASLRAGISQPFWHLPLAAAADAGYLDQVHIVGAALLIAAALRMPLLQGLLQRRSLRFLGELSYSVYLLHLPILLSAGCGAYGALTGRLGCGPTTAAIGATLLTSALTFVAARAYRRWVDAPSIRLSHALGVWLTGERTSTPVATVVTLRGAKSRSAGSRMPATRRAARSVDASARARR